ncbi:MAG: FecR family protein [Taibaiella sp.]|jgi:ferric-dicitrate binding protein FerR (iron transport regulator)
MTISPQLVARFLANTCSKDEADMVAKYFEDHPEELEQYVTEEEWLSFNTKDRINNNLEKIMWQEIKRNTTQVMLVPWYRKVSWMAAASVMLIIVSGAWLASNYYHKETTTLIAANKDTISGYATIINTGKELKNIIMEDGSIVSLSPNSSLHYQKPFDKNKRLLKLEGRAFFRVTKDAARPFIVSAGGLNTTALGTSFWIDAFKDVKYMKVQLITGKVLIQKEHRNDRIIFEDVYLIPGQEMVMDRIAKRTIVSEITSEKEEHKKQQKKVGHPAATVKLEFKQTPLKEVFKRLQQQYDVPVFFEEQDVEKMKFSGSYQSTDSLKSILNTIALVNNLKVELSGKGYRITKP